MKRARFIIKMVKRETRGSWKHFFFFIFCIALGVGSIVGVGSISAQIEHSVLKEAKGLMGGDIEIDLNHPIGLEGINTLDQLKYEGIEYTIVQEMMAMVSQSKNTATQLVELKAVGPGYPFYGSLVLDPPMGVKRSPGPNSVWAEESLLIRLGLKIGDEIKLGRAQFTVGEIIKKEPDRITEAFSLGPRVMISEEALTRAGLVQPGSRVHYRYLLKLPPTISPQNIMSKLKTSLANERASIESYSEARPMLRRFLNNLTLYLGLIGLISLFIGGIGVGNSIHAYLKEKMDTIGILKSLGATSQTLFWIYLSQTLMMGFIGSLIGAGVGLFLHSILQGLLKTLLPQSLSYFFPFMALFKGLIAGLLVVLLFSLFPLFKIKGMSAAAIFKREVLSQALVLKGYRQWISIGLIVSALLLFIFWQVDSLKVGGLFIGIFLATVLLLKSSCWIFLRLTKKIKPTSFLLRYGMANLNRPGNFVGSVIFSIGLGVTVICAILVIKTGLIEELVANIPVNAPTFFFIDIQRNQREAFERLLSRKYLEWKMKDKHEMVPIVRSRLHAVGKASVKEMKNNEAWYFQREYVLTSQKDLPYENKIIKGKWWKPDDDQSENLISLEEEVAKHLGVNIGSTLTFDIQGALVEGTVTSIRRVNWENLRTNFFVIFSPNTFKDLPMTYIATSQSSAGQDLSFQHQVVAFFPNVTVINIRHVLDTVEDIMEKILLAVQFMGGFTVISGLIVLAGSMAATKYFRLREAAILKMLGAARLKISKIFVIEYALLGMIAGFIGILMGSLFAWIFLKFIMQIPSKFSPFFLLTILLSAILLTILISFSMTYRIIGKKPLASLRQN